MAGDRVAGHLERCAKHIGNPLAAPCTVRGSNGIIQYAKRLLRGFPSLDCALLRLSSAFSSGLLCCLRSVPCSLRTIAGLQSSGSRIARSSSTSIGSLRTGFGRSRTTGGSFFTGLRVIPCALCLTLRIARRLRALLDNGLAQLCLLLTCSGSAGARLGCLRACASSLSRFFGRRRLLRSGLLRGLRGGLGCLGSRRVLGSGFSGTLSLCLCSLCRLRAHSCFISGRSCRFSAVLCFFGLFGCRLCDRLYLCNAAFRCFSCCFCSVRRFAGLTGALLHASPRRQHFLDPPLFCCRRLCATARQAGRHAKATRRAFGYDFSTCGTNLQLAVSGIRRFHSRNRPEENAILHCGISNVRLCVVLALDQQRNHRIRPLRQHSAHIDFHRPSQVLALPAQVYGGQLVRVVHYVAPSASLSVAAANVPPAAVSSSVPDVLSSACFSHAAG